MKIGAPYFVGVAVTALIVVALSFRSTETDSRSAEQIGLDEHVGVGSASAAVVSNVDALLVGHSPTSIQYPDSEVLKINWRAYPRPQFQRDQSFARNYEMFRDRAEAGDGTASLLLHDMVTSCQSAFDTEDQLENAIDRLQQTHTLQLAKMQKPVPLDDPDQIPQFVEQMRSQYQGCSQLDAEQKAEPGQWLQLAAEQRLSPAMIEYGNQIADPTEAMEWFKGAWDEGEVEGLMMMSKVYQFQYQSGQYPAHNINAYASLMAYAKLVEAGMGGADHGPIAHGEVRRVQDMLDHATDSLKQHELTEAIALSKELINSNPNCCFEM